MDMLFINIRILDVLDVLLVALLLYKLYMLIRGTAAFNIVMGIFVVYITWVIVRGLNMELMSGILGQVAGVGVVAAVVVFQPEIRKLFMLLGTKYNLNNRWAFDKLFSREKEEITNKQVKTLVTSIENMSRSKTGALIVLTNNLSLKEYIDTGERINAAISSALIETIFFKNTPLHDGAMIIDGGMIIAARCVLPITDRKLENENLGLRHRSAIGLSLATDALIIVVSEETGKISYALNGVLTEDIDPIKLTKIIETMFCEDDSSEEIKTEDIEKSEAQGA